MSRKIQTFTEIIANPMNIHNFELVIPGFAVEEGASSDSKSINLGILVQSTSFPSEKMRTTSLYVSGEQIRYGTVPQNSGTWAFKIPENDNGDIFNKFLDLRNAVWSQMEGTFIGTAKDWFDCIVIARDLNSQASFKCILHGCWLEGRNDVSLNQQSPEQNWQWDFSMRYQWLEDVKKGE